MNHSDNYTVLFHIQDVYEKYKSNNLYRLH